MFGLLKSKIANFIGSIVKKAEEKSVGTKEEKEEPKQELPELKKEPERIQKHEGKIAVPQVKKEETFVQKHEEKITHAELKKEKVPGKEEEKPAPAKKPVQKIVPDTEMKLAFPEMKKEKVADVSREKFEVKIGKGAEKPFEEKRHEKGKELIPDFGEKKTPLAGTHLASLEKAVKREPKKEVEVSIISRIKSVFSDEIELSENELSGLLDAFELSLLEADVAYEVALEIMGALRKSLAGKKVSKKRIDEEVKRAIGSVLEKAMTTGKEFDMVERVKASSKPAKILFIGPNGAGKTTTIAKIVFKLKEAGFTSVIAASDTFRAAAIEQMQVHADKLGVKLVKSAYGSDPAAVAFDAVSFAQSHKIDVVLIDSAGRQETNRNLLDELKKMVRVVKPDLKVYVGESFGGNQIIGQITEFDKAIGIDGVILTKLDCDAKGGSAISVAHATSVPVIYVGTGQAYPDLQAFSPSEMARGIME